MESSPTAIRLKPEITVYLRLYFKLISSRIRSQMQYRLSFLLDRQFLMSGDERCSAPKPIPHNLPLESGRFV